MADRRATVVAIVVIGLLVILYGAALVRGDDDETHIGASLEEIAREPDDVVGERWALAAQVESVISDEVVVVGGRDFGVPTVPVLLTSRAREVVDDGIAPGDVGMFVGQFRRLDLRQLERQTRADLPEERLARLEGDLLLVADRAGIDQDTD